MQKDDTVEWEILVSDYFFYFLKMTCFKYIFVFLIKQHVGYVCMAAYLSTWQDSCQKLNSIKVACLMNIAKIKTKQEISHPTVHVVCEGKECLRHVSVKEATTRCCFPRARSTTPHNNYLRSWVWLDFADQDGVVRSVDSCRAWRFNKWWALKWKWVQK